MLKGHLVSTTVFGERRQGQPNVHLQTPVGDLVFVQVIEAITNKDPIGTDADHRTETETHQPEQLTLGYFFTRRHLLGRHVELGQFLPRCAFSWQQYNVRFGEVSEIQPVAAGCETIDRFFKKQDTISLFIP